MKKQQILFMLAPTMQARTKNPIPMQSSSSWLEGVYIPRMVMAS